MPIIVSLARQSAGLLLLFAVSFMQSAVGAPAAQPLLEVIVMRHGVRAPDDSPAMLARSAVQAWPQWPVAQGELTPRGAALLVSQGRRARLSLDASGLLASGQCPGPRLKVVADTVDRDRDSAAAWLSGLAPDCMQDITFPAVGTGRTRLFHGGDGPHPSKVAEPITLAPPERQALDVLHHVLLGCSGAVCLQEAQARGLKIPRADAQGTLHSKALETAGSLAENIVLEAAAGLPDRRVGWGRAPMDVRQRLIVLRNADFDVRHKALAMARYQGREMLAGISATLAAAGGEPMPGSEQPLAPPETRVLVLVGHDTNLANLSGLLGLEWHRGDEPDDYPPGAALVFRLIKTAAGSRVQVHVELPTAAGLRDGDLAQPDAVSIRPIVIHHCDLADDQGCPLSNFLHLAASSMKSE